MHQMRAAVLGTFLLTLGSNLIGQTARQGNAADREPTEFQSPMVVETVFAAADRSLWKQGWFTVPEYLDLRKYSCDGVFLRGDSDRKIGWDPPINMKARNLPDGNVEVRFDLKVNNPKLNHDKVVSLKLEAVNGDEVVASGLVRIKAPDNGEGHDDEKLKLILPSAALGSTTKLRITMTTQNY